MGGGSRHLRGLPILQAVEFQSPPYHNLQTSTDRVTETPTVIARRKAERIGSPSSGFAPSSRSLSHTRRALEMHSGSMSIGLIDKPLNVSGVLFGRRDSAVSATENYCTRRERSVSETRAGKTLLQHHRCVLEALSSIGNVFDRVLNLRVDEAKIARLAPLPPFR